MKEKINIIKNKNLVATGLLFAFSLMSCAPDASTHPLGLASCPVTQKVTVLSVSYDQTQNKYSVFHTTAPGLEKLPNPAVLENLQMAQIPEDAAVKTEQASLKFVSSGTACEPVLEMSKDFKIELRGGQQNTAQNGQSSSGGGGGGSYWAPFLMGAMASHMISNAFSRPAYYMPPPAAPSGGGLVTGGVSAQNPRELNKKYESTYGQPAKSGFFAKKGGASANQSNSQKSGFFSRKSTDSGGGSSRRSSGFFKKR